MLKISPSLLQSIQRKEPCTSVKQEVAQFCSVLLLLEGIYFSVFSVYMPPTPPCLIVQ